METINSNFNTQSIQDLVQSVKNSTELRRIGNNEYIKSLLNPNFACKYPDNPVEYSYVKSILLSRTFKVPPLTGFTDEFRLVYPTRSPIQGLSFERRATDGYWYHSEVLPFTQDIKDPEMYLRQRLVTGYFEFYSSSVPIGNTVINGQLNAVKLPYTPGGFDNTDFSGMLPYASSSFSSVNNIGVGEGVTCFVPFKPTCSYKVPDDSEIYAQEGSFPKYLQTDSNISRVYAYETEQQYFKIDGSETTIFNVNNDPNSTKYDANLNVNLGCYQMTSISLTGALGYAQENHASLVKIRVYMRTIDAQGQKQEFFERVVNGTSQEQIGNVSTTFSFLATGTINGIEVVTTYAPVSNYGFQVIYTQHNYEASQEDNPLLVVLGKGQDADTEFSLTGKINVEIIPGTKLKREIPSQARINDDVDDRQIAYNFLNLLRERKAFDGIATRRTAQMMMLEAAQADYTRENLSNLAFIGPLLARVGSTLLRGLQTGLKYGPQAYSLGQEIVSDFRRSERSQRNQAAMNMQSRQSCGKSNLAMMQGGGGIIRRSERMAKKTAQHGAGTMQTSSKLLWNKQFRVSRRYPYIARTDDQIGLGTITVTNIAPKVSALQVKITKDHILDEDVTLYVTGYDGELPENITGDAAYEWREDEQHLGGTRIIQFALLISRMTNSKVLHFDFRSDNGEMTSSYSFSFALEAIVLDLPVEFVYSGDSNPSIGMTPSRNMGWEFMRSKIGKEPQWVTLFKYDPILNREDRSREVDMEIPLMSEVDYFNNNLPMGIRVTSAAEVQIYLKFMELSGGKIPETADMRAQRQAMHDSEQRRAQEHAERMFEAYQQPGPQAAPMRGRSPVRAKSPAQTTTAVKDAVHIIQKVGPAIAATIEASRPKEAARPMQTQLVARYEQPAQRMSREERLLVAAQGGKKNKPKKRSLDQFLEGLDPEYAQFYRNAGYLEDDNEFMTSYNALKESMRHESNQFSITSLGGFIDRLQQIQPSTDTGQAPINYKIVEELIGDYEHEKPFNLSRSEKQALMYVLKAVPIPDSGIVFESSTGGTVTIGSLIKAHELKPFYRDQMALGQLSNLKTLSGGGTLGKNQFNFEFQMRNSLRKQRVKPRQQQEDPRNPYLHGSGDTDDEEGGQDRLGGMGAYYGEGEDPDFGQMS